MAPTIAQCGPSDSPDSMYQLSFPLAEALALPDAVRTRLGFDMDYGQGLGLYDPSVVLPSGS